MSKKSKDNLLGLSPETSRRSFDLLCNPTDENLSFAYTQVTMFNSLKVRKGKGEEDDYLTRYRLQKERIKELPIVRGVRYELQENGDVVMNFRGEPYKPSSREDS